MEKLNFKALLLVVAYLMFTPNYGQTTIVSPENLHPRGLLLSTDIEDIRDKIRIEPFKAMFALIRTRAEATSITVYDDAKKIADQAFIYLLTEDQQWSDRSYENIKKLVLDTMFVQNPFSKGLTRAYILKQMAMAYDFSYNGWSSKQRKFVNQEIYKLMLSVANNMGIEANYSAESNWMGVRYGSVVFGANIIDDTFLDSNQVMGRKAYLWDAQKRLQDHIKAGFTEHGWFSETLGYHVYNASFILPAIISLQHSSSSKPVFTLPEYAPRLIHSIDQHITSTVSIPTISGVGIKADLGDDNPMTGSSLFAYGARLMPARLKPYLKWMLDYLYDGAYIQNPILTMCFYPEEIEAMNPETETFLNYIDTTQGVVFFRNEFKDKNDIVASFNTSSNRIKGHSAPDNLTFRIIGLGSLWAIGAGRTAEVAGQTNLFPTGNWQEQMDINVEGTLTKHHFEKDGSGYAAGHGSSLGVDNHWRKFTVDYSKENDVEAVFTVEDKSENGHTWRMNTPEFNTVKPLYNGFLITAPNGSSMKATVIGSKKAEISIGKATYGATTVANNTGIAFKGKKYTHTKTIDIACDKNITVIMTLQPKGKSHPEL